jgi:hypothetical protein
MKIGNALAISWLALGAGCASSSPIAVPVEREPLHQIALENEIARVYFIEVPPGAATLFHTHVRDGIGIKLADALIQDETMDGPVENLAVKRGAVGFSHYATPRTHRVINIGTTPFLNVYVELMRPASAPQSFAFPAATPVVLDNERVLASRSLLLSEQATEVDSLRGFVRVALTAGTIRITTKTSAATVTLRPGEIAWYAQGERYTFANVGDMPFESVDVWIK